MNRLISALILSLMLVLPVHAEDGEWTYEFKEDQNFWLFAQDVLKDWRKLNQLRSLNKIGLTGAVDPGTTIRVPVQWLNMQDAPANIATSTGDVKLYGVNGQALNFNSQTPVGAGFALATGPESTALIAFQDGSKMLVQQETRIEFEVAETVGSGLSYNYRVGLPNGKIENRANPLRTPGSTFLVATPSSVTATKGTIYRVGAEGDITRTEVTSGLVGVGNEFGEVEVAAGFGIVTEKGVAPSAPVKLLSTPEMATDLGVIRYLPSVIRWRKVENATSYRIQISRDNTFNSLRYALVSKRQAVELPLTMTDGKYFVRVSAVDVNGLEGPAVTSQLTLRTNFVPPAQLTAAEFSNQYNDAIRLRWSGVPNAANYIVEISKGRDASAVVHKSEGLIGTDYTVSLPNESGLYRWRVTAYDQGGEPAPRGPFGLLKLLPAPAAGTEKSALGGDDLVVQWPFLKASSRIMVQLATDEDFENIVVEKNAKGYYTELGAVDQGEYFARYYLLNDADTPVSTSATHKINW